MILEPVRQAVITAISDTYDLADIPVEVSYPDPKFGDATTNVAFQLAKQLKKTPNQIAQELADGLTDDIIAEATAINGFINIRLTVKFWLGQIHQISPQYGRSNLGKGQKVQVEFISANPTGPTTIGNARGGYIGDTLANVLDSQGYEVTREYYFNNAGTQIGKLLESIKVAAGLGKADELQYSGAYIKELAHIFKDDLGTKSDDELRELITQEILKRYIEPAIKKMGVTFDVWFNENDLIADGRFEKTLNTLKHKGLVFERDGAIWLDTGKLGVKREERVIVKSNGDPTYLAPDIAYHDDLFGRREFDRVIKVLGADHFDQFPSVRAAVLALHPQARLEMAGHQWFRLLKDGKEIKVSKRLGQFVTVEELIDEVGPDVARFMTLQRSADTNVDFDLDLAKEHSQKNPLYYVMYSYARAHSILEQASEKGLKPASSSDELSAEGLALVRHMSRFPDLLEEIAGDFGVHRLVFFGMEIAKLFHDLYESEKIIDLGEQAAGKRLYVIAQYIAFMESYWEILGITPVQRMDREPS